MTNLHFGAPHWFWALASVPVLILFFVQAERRGALRLQEFVSARLLPGLSGTVNRFRRWLRFVFLLLALSLGIVALARPQWGYIFDELKRRGLDLLIAVDTSRSMLSNDVQPNRLERVKLATQDLVNEMQGDRVGLIAFAGRAFLQAPLTIDYDAAVEAIDDLDTHTIPEGGTNISAAINLAVQTFGKSATGNRALIIFTDGEELSGDAVSTAKMAAENGVRIFAVGVGTPEGSLIPIAGEDGGTAFVKDEKGQVVKSKLDETRLGEIAKETGGIYLHLESGPGTMKKLFVDGLGKMQAGDINARTSRTPIERYQWPLGAAIAALVAFFFVGERKQIRRKNSAARPARATLAAAAILLLGCPQIFAAAPGLQFYRDEKFPEAYAQLQQTLKDNPETKAADKIQFDAGAAAYKMKDYGKALDSFSQALLSPEKNLQSASHYNLGNTLYERGETQKSDEKKLGDWENAVQHYEQTLKLEPKNKEAQENRDYVKKKIDELKNKKPPPTPSPTPKPTPTPTPSPSPNQDKNNKKSSDNSQDKKQDQKDQQNKDQGDNSKKDENKSEKSDDKNQQKQDQEKDEKQKSGESPTPTPSASPSSSALPSPSENQKGGASATPSPTAGENEKSNPNQSGEGQQTPTPSPSENGNENQQASPSPSPGENSEGENGASPSPTPNASPEKKLAGDVKGAPGEKPQASPPNTDVAEAEPEQEGQMSEKQAEALLRSMKDEEQRVLLDERKAARHVYNDW